MSTDLNLQVAGIKDDYKYGFRDSEENYAFKSGKGLTREIVCQISEMKNDENELPGIRALEPDYSISQDINFDNVLTIYNNVFANDLILIRTLGLNFKDVKKQYYVWSNQVENILMTQLPPPIDLDQAKYY